MSHVDPYGHTHRGNGNGGGMPPDSDSDSVIPLFNSLATRIDMLTITVQQAVNQSTAAHAAARETSLTVRVGVVMFLGTTLLFGALILIFR